MDTEFRETPPAKPDRPGETGSAGPRLRLHIPPRGPAPGEPPYFSYVPQFPAGAVERPEIAVPAQQTHPLAYQLIGVLDDDGAAVGAWNPVLPPETLRRGLRAMMLTRAYDDRMFRQQRQGKITFYMKCTGEEAIGVGQAFALAPDDMAFTTYRQQGLLIARGWPLLDMMCQCYSNARDRLKGRQVPVILNVVNNQWAISSHQEIAGGEAATFAARAIGFGLACLRVDGNDFLAVYGATQWAAERARANQGATLIEFFTYRAAAHSTSDDPSRYRPEDEWANWPYGDPIERLSRHLTV